VLSAVKFASNSDHNQLAEPVVVAQVLSTPTVTANDATLYMSASNELRINGTGLTGARKVDLYFQPPLLKEVAYEDVTPYPLSKNQNQVVLRLRHGYNWRDTPGPLFVVGLDTGGGPIKTGGDDGVKVADVHDYNDFNTVVVGPTADSQLIYHDQPQIVVRGQNFNPVGNVLRWANGLLGNGVNYTTVSSSENMITLRLVPGSTWRKIMADLPGTLTLLAVNAGGGFVAVGPINSGKGCDVATVFERPTVLYSPVQIFRSYSHELRIRGSGFPELATGHKPQLKFLSPLLEGVDYTIRVVGRTDLALTLLDGRAWRDSAGPLTVTHINTRGDTGGWIELPGAGVQVAEVIEGASVPSSVAVYPMGVKVYQSALQQHIEIAGSGFTDGMTFTLDPPLVLNQDYEMEVISKKRIVFYLKNGKKWRKEPGLIIARSVKVDDQDYQLAGSEGFRVAMVLADPVITASQQTLHETQSKLLTIHGTGFTNVADVKLGLRPTSPVAYRMRSVINNSVVLELKRDNAWVPSFFNLKDEPTKHMLLQIGSIDTGAGEILFDNPVTVANVYRDIPGVTCDDSCEFAFDGVCDDGSNQDDDTGTDQGGHPEDDYYADTADGQHGNNGVTACVRGTDCTDCGGVEKVVSAKICTNDCVYAKDGVCDDPRGFGYCALGESTFHRILLTIYSPVCGCVVTCSPLNALQVPTARTAAQPSQTAAVTQAALTAHPAPRPAPPAPCSP
jgi:hypothetical protein